MKKEFLFVLYFFLANSLYASLPMHIISTKNMTYKHLLKLYEQHPFTFFCEQRFNQLGEIMNSSCKNCPKERIQWMPIVPYQLLAKDRMCFKEKICINNQGMRFKGLRCCQKLDLSFNKASFDLYNYVPERSLIKQQRHLYRFEGALDKSNAKKCHFYIDKKNKTIEVLPSKLGLIARTYLYMRDTYYLPLSDKETALFLSWHQQNPPDEWERERSNKIKAIQGNANPYVH